MPWGRFGSGVATAAGRNNPCKHCPDPDRASSFYYELLRSRFNLQVAQAGMGLRELHRDAFHVIRDLAIKIEKHPSAHFSENELKDLGIEVAAIDLETGEAADDHELFCRPLAGDVFEKLMAKNHKIDWDSFRELQEHHDGYDSTPDWADNFDKAIDTAFMLRQALRGIPANDDSRAYRSRRYMNPT